MLELLIHPCIFYKLTGYYCPGCGGTRAVMALFNGQVIRSFLYHPIVPYIAVLLLWYLIDRIAGWISGGRQRAGMRISNRYLYAGLVIVLVNWAVRNFLLWRFGIGL